MNDAINVGAGSAWDQPIVEWVWREKYRYGSERTRDESFIRVTNAVYDKDREGDHRERALRAMRELRWCPAGRIHAGAGTGNRVTLINCFVAPTLQDSMDTEGTAAEDGGPDLGIMDNLKVAALTQQMGGGIGTDFSPLRPNGALVKRTGSVASGPLPFMDMWDAMCGTVMSAGARRGAMMATLRCDHPDIEAFITAKRTPGRLTNFNLSVLVTDAFMAAIKTNSPWQLHFGVPPANGGHLTNVNGRASYVYKQLPARQLWDLILRNTYEHAEPGVIFIDRVNGLNNLRHLETIAATNPCGEQPLPPNGDCNLGAVNLAVHAFDNLNSVPAINWEKLEDTVRVGVRFLDNVLDVTQFPTAAQRLEAKNKRRIGLGVTGLANLLQQMRVRYGSKEAVELTERIMCFIANAAYDESANLAQERGRYPMWQSIAAIAPFISKLDPIVRRKIKDQGLRNGVLLTVAPTGTTSLYYDNVSSGIEPTFSWKYTRKTLEKDGSKRDHAVWDWGWLRWTRGNKLPANWEPNKRNGQLPDYMVTAEQLTVEEHLQMQAAAQRWVDASISKTINCPANMTYEEFRGVYERAMELGLKGVTTYRSNPAGGRGAVLEVSTAAEPIQLGKIETSGGAGGGPGGPAPGEVLEKQQAEVMRHVLQVPPSDQALRIQAAIEGRVAKRARPDKLPGVTYKIRSPHRDHAYYVTICNDEHGQPFEVFVATKDANAHEWLQALTRMISAVFRKGGDIEFVAQELREVRSMEGWFEREHYVPGLVARIGEVIEEHIKSRNVKTFTATGEYTKPAPLAATREVIVGRACPRCAAPALTKRDGCDLCTSCGYTKCD